MCEMKVKVAVYANENDYARWTFEAITATPKHILM